MAKPKVLVVDDENVIADTLAIILNRAGYDDASATYDGPAAVELARSIRPDAVISDVNHPGLNGIETAFRIREFLPTCKILFISGQAHSTDLLQDARSRGYAFELVAKPTSPRALLHWLQVGGEHDVRSCNWCQEQRALSGGAYPHVNAEADCRCTWCSGLRAGYQPPGVRSTGCG